MVLTELEWCDVFRHDLQRLFIACVHSISPGLNGHIRLGYMPHTRLAVFPLTLINL